jgi:hypothetical protein
VPTHRCEDGRCARREGASCDGDHTVTSPFGVLQDCGLYKCEGATCKTGCTSIEDCAFPAVCSFEHLCVAPDGGSEGGGCRVAHTPTSVSLAGWLVMLAWFVMRSRDRVRAGSARA